MRSGSWSFETARLRGQRCSQLVRRNPFRNREGHLKLAMLIQQTTRSHKRHADDVPLGIEAYSVALGSLVEVRSSLGIPNAGAEARARSAVAPGSRPEQASHEGRVSRPLVAPCDSGA